MEKLAIEITLAEKDYYFMRGDIEYTDFCMCVAVVMLRMF